MEALRQGGSFGVGPTARADRRHGHPMEDAVIDEIDGRLLRIGNRWLVDFASSNYLGFDLEPRIVGAIPAYLARWGTLTSWPGLRGSTALCDEIEARLATLLRAPAAFVLPTSTHIHLSVIPVLAGEGTIYLDDRAHRTVEDGCSIALAHGATLRRFRVGDPDELATLLESGDPGPRLICIEGVSGRTGNAPDLPTIAALAREYDALVYVDDTHGFGVVGERAGDELCPYGMSGNGIVRHHGETYENIVLVAGFTRAYSSPAAFIACTSELQQLLRSAVASYLCSGPSPVASLAMVLEGLELNESRGDAIRFELYRRTKRVLNRLCELGIATPSTSGHPIVEIPLEHHRELGAVGRHLFDRGIYVTLVRHPPAPRGEAGVRVQVTAANTRGQIENLLVALGGLADRFQLRGTDAWPLRKAVSAA